MKGRRAGKDKEGNKDMYTTRQLTVLMVMAMSLMGCRGEKAEPATPQIDTIPMMVMQIQKCSRLYTAEYHIHKIITHDDRLSLNGKLMKKDFSVDLPLGKRKVAIPMDATVKGYIDFEGFSQHNVRRNGEKIEITLPDPHVTLTSTRIDHEGVRQYVALTRSRFSDEELTDYEQQGRQAVIASIPQMGIVEMTRENAARTLVPMIVQMGYSEENITITFRKDFNKNDIRHLLEQKDIEHGKEKN